MDDATKQCDRCHVAKPLDAFYRSSAKPDGLQGRCKLCQRTDSSARAKRNPAKAAEQAAKWRARNVERAREIGRDWARADYHANKGKWLESAARAEKKARSELRPSYVKRLIARRVGCKPTEVPAALVAAKAALLRTQRLISKEKE